MSPQESHDESHDSSQDAREPIARAAYDSRRWVSVIISDMRLCFKRAAALVSLLALTLVPAALRGAPARVRLLRQANGGALLREIVARTAGEVVAAGFSVDLQDVPPGLDSEPSDAPATVAITSPGAGADDAIIEVWLGRELVYRSEIGGDAGAGDERALTASAVRAVAVMQAALLAREARPAPASNTEVTPAAAIATRAIPPPSVRAPRRFGADLGVSMLQSLQGVGATYAPVLRLSYRFTPLATVGIRGVTFGSSASAAAPAGTARIRQDLALLDGTLSFRRSGRVHPAIVAGGGLYHMSISGSGAAPFVGRSDGAWGAAAAAGLGLSIDVSARAAIAVESQVLWVWPEARVLIDTADVGRAGRPSLSHLVGLRLWL